MRRGVTLVESIIAVLLSTVVVGMIWNFWVQARRSEVSLTAGLSARQDLQLAVQRLTRELQEGVAIFYPRPEDDVQSGVGFVDATGRSIFYYLEPDPDGAPGGVIHRVDLGTRERRVICRGVNYFRVKVPEPAPGKKESLVSFNLSVLRSDADTLPGAVDYAMVSKVFLRNLEMPLPD